MIKIKGVIGWDVIGTEFADLMQRLTGDVDIEIDSPGGYVTDGLSIFNAIKQYKRGKVNIRVVGQASSMAAYVMLAGSSLSFMPNAIVVLHNPWNMAIGDYRVMQKNGELLEKLAALYAEQFVEKGIFSEKEIRSIMDEETWFVGKKDLAKLGEVESDNDEDSGEDDLSQDRDIVIQAAKERIHQCKAKMSEREFDMKALDRIAAMIPTKTPAADMSSIAAPASATSVQMPPQTTQTNDVNTNKKGEKSMKNGEELKAQFPNVYAEVFEAGKAAGKTEEKDRVDALMGFIDDDKDTIVAAIKDGGSIVDQGIQAKLLQARLNAQTIAGMQSSNAAAVDPKEPDHADENEQNGGDKGSNAEDAAAKEQAMIDKIVAKMGLDAE